MSEKKAVGGKKEMVQDMFNDIAPRYDLLNHLLSADIDKIWRKKVRKSLEENQPETILDVASGTGDLAIELSKLPVKKIIGMDIAAEMLDIGRKKIKKKGLENLIEMEVGDSENMKYKDASFDVVTVAFGVRNFENLDKGLKEMYRVVKTGGRVAVLEFSKPSAFPMKQVYQFYFRYILPGIGKLVSRNETAYTYLPNSVAAFPEGDEFMQRLKKAGFRNIKQNRLTFGISTLYIADK